LLSSTVAASFDARRTRLRLAAALWPDAPQRDYILAMTAFRAVSLPGSLPCGDFIFASSRLMALLRADGLR